MPTHEEQIVVLFARLIALMATQAREPSSQSFGSLSHHLKDAVEALVTKRYRSPLYYLALPRWMGEYGNTPIEEEILSLANELSGLVVELNGGADAVNRIRAKRNETIHLPKI